MTVVGLIIGAIAKLIMPGHAPGGLAVTILLGVGGSILAGLIGHAAGWYQGAEPARFIPSVVGAIIILAVYRILAGRRPGGGRIHPRGVKPK
jgi:uncharacterized membrane protein YeaQ/YmgE (transglycosylase-associated protein family)